ncbi:hypothetical protein [Streptomyces bluensis]|uniref:Uncharacterized protein n=1 Tax=Streptomyces bluensis TaxID=33897 RepID=A0ABW6UAM9_9ACTN
MALPLAPPREEGEPERVVELCAGRAVLGRGLRTVLGVARFDVGGVDFDKDACPTARAVGHVRICADVTKIDPEYPALRGTRGVIIHPSMPAPSTAGKHAGSLEENLNILCETIAAVGEAAGFDGSPATRPGAARTETRRSRRCPPAPRRRPPRRAPP